MDRMLSYGREQLTAFFRKVAPFKNILDLGAGWGFDLANAAKVCPEATRYAVETYPPYVEHLKTVGHEVLVLNLEKDPLPLADGSIDLVMSNQVMEHVKEVFWILHESTRVLRVGGHMIIGVPNLASYHNRLMLLVGLQPTSIQNHSAHLRGYTRHDIVRSLNLIFPGGYKLRGFKGANFYPMPGALAKLLAKVLPNGSAAIFLLLEKTGEYDGEFLKHPVEQKLETNYFLGPGAGRMPDSN